MACNQLHFVCLVAQTMQNRFDIDYIYLTFQLSWHQHRAERQHQNKDTDMQHEADCITFTINKHTLVKCLQWHILPAAVTSLYNVTLHFLLLLLSITNGFIDTLEGGLSSLDGTLSIKAYRHVNDLRCRACLETHYTLCDPLLSQQDCVLIAYTSQLLRLS